VSSEITLEAGKLERHYWSDLWRYRELLYVLAWRDIAVRYKQTAVGVAWVLVQPLAQMLVLAFIFGKLAKLPSEGAAPYALMVMAAMLPWQFFATSLTSASLSLVANANVVSKVYFPRMVVPLAAVVTSFVDFLVGLLLLAALMAWYGYWPTVRVLWLPAFMALAFLSAIGPGLLLTALNVSYRDFRFVVPFLVQFGLYASPVGFSSAVVRERFGETAFLLYSLNPMVGVIDGFRWAILGGEMQLHALGFAISIALSVALLAAGLAYFRRVERTIADVI
jgi:lipopolysaccharide transport system permease protein